SPASSGANGAEPAAADNIADAAPSPASLPEDDRPAEPTRASILAAFARKTPPQPAQQPAPQPQPRSPERRAERPAEPEPISEAAFDEIVPGWQAGTISSK